MRASQLRPLALTFAALAALAVPHLAHAGISTAGSFTTGYRYDLQQRVVGTIAPDPDDAGPLHYAAVRNTYDADGRLTKVESGELAAWQDETVEPRLWQNYTTFTVFKTVDYVYDGDSRRTKETLSSGGVAQTVTQTSYDALDRPVCVATRMDPNQWNSQTDACVPQTAAAAGPDRITRTLYNQTGTVDRIQKAFGTGIQQDYVAYTYTATNKVASVTDANQNRAQYAYDSLDRITRWYFPSKTMPGLASTDDYEAYTYDYNGNRLSLRKRDGSTLTYDYDALNRMKLKVVPDRAGLDSHLTTGDVYYSYDNRGLLTSANFDNTPNEGVTSSYDSAGRLTSSTTTMFGVGRTLNYTYDQDSNRVQTILPDGIHSDFGYDGLDRADIGTWTNSGGTTQFADYNYNSQGLRSSRAIGSASTGYYYDGVDRLSNLQQWFPSSANNLVQLFGFNPASQIVSATRDNDAFAYTGQYSVNRTYVVNGLNQYTTAGPDTLQYDANGNLISDTVNGATTSYVYDVENRLVWVSNPGMSLYYDPLGRLWRTSTTSGSVNRFVHDGDNLVAEYNGDSASATMTKRYIFGPGVDEPLVEDNASFNCSATRMLHADNQGSIIAQADCWGNRTQVNTYDEYGIPGSANMGRFQYTGQMWMPEIGLYYYKARMYSPTLGRFMQTDPIGYKDQISLYAYVGNDPTNRADPTGEATAYSLGENMIVVVQTFSNTTSFSDSQIAAQGGRLSGFASDGKLVLVVLVPVSGRDVTTDTARITVNPVLRDSSSLGFMRPHTDQIGGRNIQVGPHTPVSTTGHEFGHVLKAGDQYAGGVSADGKTVKSNVPGAENIMRDNTGNANTQTVDEVQRGVAPDFSKLPKCKVSIGKTLCE